MNINKKLKKLQDILSDLDSLLVAYSGGVDSTFLLKIAHDTLGDKVMAVTATSKTYPPSELREAIRIAKQLGVRHLIIKSEELNVPEFLNNPPERCYYCKKELFQKLRRIARKHKLKNVVDASNYDDLKDFRPGRKAARELGVRSPLLEAELTKEEIRRFSRKLGLVTWDKPSLACLASRIPYGERITPQKLSRIDKAENYLRSLGMRQVRVRLHGDIARIEVSPPDLYRLIGKALRLKVTKKLKSLGFPYITIDLEGYRTGSMNEILKK